MNVPNATEKALKELGVKPDHNAVRDLNKQRKGGKPSKTALNYYDKKTGKQVYSKTGTDVTNKHQGMKYWNDKATNWDKAKTIGKASAKGAGDSLKDTVNVKDVVKDVKGGSIVKGASKSLGVFGAGLNYYSNYHDAKDEGLSTSEAASRATVDTAVDTAVSGAVQAGMTAAFTAAIPVPGVGTAIGVTAGIGANALLNVEFSFGNGPKKSVMDRTKGALHKIKGWFS